jgi:hypothetical protein
MQEGNRHRQQQSLEILQRENAIKWERLQELYRQAASLEEQEEARRVSARLQRQPRLLVEADPASRDEEDPEDIESDSIINKNHASDLPLPSGGDDLDQRRIQVEIAYLSRSRWASESEEVLRLLQGRRGSGVDLANSSSAWIDGHEQEDLYSAEIIQSYHNTKEINRVLLQEIHSEKENLRQLIALREESREINVELAGETQRLQQEAEDGNAQASSMEQSDNGSAMSNVESLNKTLRSDLSYATICIENKLLSDPYRDDSPGGANGKNEETWSLETLLLHLVTLLLQPSSGADAGDQDHCIEPEDGSSWCVFESGGTPYLAVDEYPIRSQHVRLLTECSIAESHKDDENLIRLVDYRP